MLRWEKYTRAGVWFQCFFFLPLFLFRQREKVAQKEKRKKEYGDSWDFGDIVDGINAGTIKFISLVVGGTTPHFDLKSVSKNNQQLSMTFTFTDNTTVVIYEQDIVEFGGDTVTML